MIESIQTKLMINGKLVSKRCTQKYLERCEPNILQYVNSYGNYIPGVHSIREVLLAIINQKPLYSTCNVCHNPTKIIQASPLKYANYCSAKCAANSKNFISRFQKRDEVAANSKRKLTMISKYGVEYNSQRDDIKASISTRLSESQIGEKAFQLLSDSNWLDYHYNILNKSAVRIASEIGVFYGTVLSYCRRYGFTIQQHYNTSQGEVEICEFLKQYEITFVRNSKILNNLEVDIFIPEYNVGIEYHGLYWHSMNTEDIRLKNLHKDKADIAQKNGIQLLQIFSDEWEHKKDIWKSIILHKLGKSSNRVFARKCTLKYIDSRCAREFYVDNHLHGFVGGTHIALIYDDYIVGILTYGKSRFDNTFEILRICFKQGYHVAGGVSKLLTYLPVGEYTTYGDKRFTSFMGYTNNFVNIASTQPGYYWVTPGSLKRISRYTTQKHKLHNLLDLRYDPVETEKENMFRCNYRLIYDAGHYKFKYIQNKCRN